MAEGIQLTGLPPQAAGTEAVKPQVAPTQTAKESEATVSPAAETVVSVQELEQTVNQLNELMQHGQRSLAFSVDDQAGEVVIQVRDRDTEELIRQIPTPEALELKKHLDGVIGLLFNDKA